MADRWYICVYLQSLTTKTSGESFYKEGEWYFLTNGSRYPSKGHIKLGKNETFSPPDPKPLLWSTMTNKKDEIVRIEFKVKEEDILKDDLMLQANLNVFYENKDQSYELKTGDGNVTMKVRLVVIQKPEW